MDNSGYSLSDIAALMGNNRDNNFLEGNGILIILFFFLMFGGGFGGFGANAATQGALTRAELAQGFADNQVLNKLDNITSGLCNQTYDLTNTMSNGFNANTLAMTNGFNNVNMGINNLGYQNQQCCCELKTAIHAEGEATRQLIQQNTIDGLNAKLADRDRELLTANLQLSQQAQNATLINSLRPFPQPAYITTSPYTSVNGFGCNNGCGCY